MEIIGIEKKNVNDRIEKKWMSMTVLLSVIICVT